ncbi:hypothetical protein [Cardinium endosymbiont of Sogatella furcifera]|uniref:hypothetical protein n=1 Tax=Cardinium endosymbiont of Sogatella furcifera TaxID=650378 RepID=UPI000E0D2787|nr:hypothetical protein [Cardinium endosymbiont of Sogatella furcifera]
MQNSSLQRAIIYTIVHLAIGYMLNGCWGCKQAKHKLKNIKHYTETYKLTQKKEPQGTNDQNLAPVHAAYKDKDDQKGIVHLEKNDNNNEEENDDDDEEEENNPYHPITKHQLNVPKSLRSAIKNCIHCSQDHNDAWGTLTINKLLAKPSKKHTFLLNKAIMTYKQKKLFSEKLDKSQLETQAAQYEKEVDKLQQQKKEIAELPSLCNRHKKRWIRSINRKKQFARYKFQDVQQALKNRSYPKQQYVPVPVYSSNGTTNPIPPPYEHKYEHENIKKLYPSLDGYS